MGSPIFRSVAIYDIIYTETKRNLILLRLNYRRKLHDGFTMSVNLEPTFDIGIRKLDHYLGFYFIYKTVLFLFKRRN